MLKKVSTEKAPAAIGPYSQAIIADKMLIASGQIPINPVTGNVETMGIVDQTEQVMKNIGAVLAEAGTDYKNVVKTTCFLSDINDFVPFNEVYVTAFKADFPARSAVEVARLPRDVKIEIEVIAYLD